ncbi:MAG: type II toxin-antitoxin system VapC family toxin [Campylobacterales bacterium]|nr:type II toxin-antitoxin system VapC family toxin [Campylobacterales bacterium]
MYSRVFLDANVIADIYDESRPSFEASDRAITYLVANTHIKLFTSCDIITTLYYIFSKNDKSKALEAIMQINTLCEVVEFGNNEITYSYALMQTNKNYKDLEDTIQYVMAKKMQCDLILSNDKGFVSQDIELMSTKELANRL